jgi:hypothetical protein
MDSEWTSFVLLLVGFALLLNPLVPGVHIGSETVYEYEAVSVEYEQGEGLNLTNVQSGQQLEPLSVDDEIVCEADWDRRLCRLERFVQQNGSVPGYVSAGFHYPSDYEFVYLDEQFYRPTTIDRCGGSHLALESVNDSDPLREVARTDLTRLERRVVESGSVVTYRKLSREDQLLRVDADYYFVYQTARKRYSGGRDNCHSSGDGFCSNADWKRRIDTALTLGSRLVGLVLLIFAWERIQRGQSTQSTRKDEDR